jgi:hypothetical protein
MQATEKYFAGIGARKTPTSFIPLIKKLGEALSNKGYILRSGGAIGSDSFWKTTYQGRMEIYKKDDICVDALALAKSIHPNWSACDSVARSLHARNCYQILGKDLNTPSELVICWTPEGKIVGGTATALRLAKINNIPIFNLAIPKDVNSLESYIENIGIFG